MKEIWFFKIWKIFLNDCTQLYIKVIWVFCKRCCSVRDKESIYQLNIVNEVVRHYFWLKFFLLKSCWSYLNIGGLLYSVCLKKSKKRMNKWASWKICCFHEQSNFKLEKNFKKMVKFIRELFKLFMKHKTKMMRYYLCISPTCFQSYHLLIDWRIQIS